MNSQRTSVGRGEATHAPAPAPARVAVIGAGPAGIYAAHLLVSRHPAIIVDIIEQDPAPFGLIRYGVAPDHPRIKAVVDVLTQIMEEPRIRLIGNVRVGRDVTIGELRSRYTAVVAATGAQMDRELPIPGADLNGSFGAAQFVAWFNGHPEAPRNWQSLSAARTVGVIGAGNVSLDVTRILARPARDLLSTDIPDNVYAGLQASAIRDIHVFIRGGPAHTRFSPLELRELGDARGVRVVVDPRDLQLDEQSEKALRANRARRLVMSALERFTAQAHVSDATQWDGDTRHVYMHFWQLPVRIDSQDDSGAVASLTTERTTLAPDGSLVSVGQPSVWQLDGLFRAVGYRSSVVEGIPFDEPTHTIRHVGGRVIDDCAQPVPGLYATGWAKRGPVGLIGHTKSDAAETVAALLDDLAASLLPASTSSEPLKNLLEERHVEHTTWAGWKRLDAYEKQLGQTHSFVRDRVKVVDRAEMVTQSSSNQDKETSTPE